VSVFSCFLLFRWKKKASMKTQEEEEAQMV